MPVFATRRPLFTSTVLLSFALLAGLTQGASAQSDLNGYWDLRAPIGDGTFRETFFELHQSGQAVTGRLLGHGTNGIPVTGTLNGTAVHLVATVPSSPNSPRPPIVFDGSFEGGRMTLESHFRRGEVSKGMAERSTKEAAMPPAPLPLPAPRDLADNGLARTPPMGWNSWNKFAGKITDADVRMMADAMVSSGMSKVGYNYINIDDTWELGRDAKGNITTNSKFPI